MSLKLTIWRMWITLREVLLLQIPEIEKEPERMPEYKVPETERGRF
jgi:hypothetical protein